MPIGYKYVETAGRSYDEMTAAIIAAGGRIASEQSPLRTGSGRVVLADYLVTARCGLSTTAEGAVTALQDLLYGSRVKIYDLPEGAAL